MKHYTARSQSVLLLSDKEKSPILTSVRLQMIDLKLNNNPPLPIIVKNNKNKIHYRSCPKRKIVDTQLWKARVTDSKIQQKIDMQRSVSLKDILKLNSKPNLGLMKRAEYVNKNPRWSTSLQNS
ncbi:unnamed protein product [Blepharisma stoltei]|uniref:Uncharacterized protein n=1 Tax=Blepharisma stoltei TaxID=1481888 RepID=A0AAU9IKS6_9CILI|nr:unnamed protein product [Blepharisma stoltei]